MNGLADFISDNFFTIITTVFAFVGGIFALVQWQGANKLKRVEFLDKIITTLRHDKENAETMYMIDYDDSWYNRDFHDNSENDREYLVDKLLSQLNFICYLYEMKIIRQNELKIIRYELSRTCGSHRVQTYLWNLYHFAKKNNTDVTFHYLVNYGIKNKIIDEKEFYLNNSKEYTKCLNFGSA